MADNCEQINIPQVDNSQSACSECGYFDIECLTISKSLPYLGVSKDSTLGLIIDKIVKDLKAKGVIITELRTAAQSAAQYYMYNNAVETVIAGVDTPISIEGATTAGEVVIDFDVDTDDNKAVYTGALTGVYQVTATADITAQAGDILRVQVFKNGIAITEAKVSEAADASGEVFNLTVTTLVELAKDDYIEIFVANGTQTGNILVNNMNVVIARV